MRRKNPETGKFFQRGDLRPDGFVFFAYTNRIKSNGQFIEIWLSPEASNRATTNDRQRKRQKAHGNSLRHASSDA